MFGQSKPVTFDPYGRRRSRWRLPRWLVLLLLGIALGAGGVVLIQERYLPPRLSADASAQLRSAYGEADAERLRLKRELEATVKRLQLALTDKKAQVDELASARATAERLRGDLASVVASLPADPRGGAIEVRAGRFAARDGMLSYDVVLSRDRAQAKPIEGLVQFVVAGQSARGVESSFTTTPFAVSIGPNEVVRGRLPLPEGFRPRQTTIQVLGRAAGKPLGMRVLLVG
jgi:hypothetical protein